MTFSKNMDLCKNSYRNVWEYMSKPDENIIEDGSIQLATARNGESNLLVDQNGVLSYLHSQYNPSNEAEQWIKSYLEDAQKSKHIFFFGVGMGYHINLLMNKTKSVPFTIYEPLPSILYHFLQNKPLNDLPTKNLKNILFGSSVDYFTQHFLEHFSSDVLIIINPAYERLFPELTKNFIEVFKSNIQHKLSIMHTHLGYEKIWTYNAEFNFSKLRNTQNVIREKKQFFENKPVVLVAAGPSLEDEFSNLREIKSKGLAYIFAVGSANKALIANNIYPDAVISYDPNPTNHLVFAEVINNKITNIPLIFGSTVGFQTLELYPGPMLHMFINQDHISPYFIGGEGFINNEEVISDAASIAVVTLQLLKKLGSSLVILVGQNFAFRNKQYYAQGIEYNLRPTHLSEEEQKVLVSVESVSGGVVWTQEVHNIARKQMEQVIAEMTNVTVFNSTKDGAKIEGAVFEDLTNLISTHLTTVIVDNDWYKGEPTAYDSNYILSQYSVMKKQHADLDEMLMDIVRGLKKLEASAATLRVQKTASLLDQVSKYNSKLYNNLYYKVFLEPMVKIQFDIFQKSLIEINPIRNVTEKARAVVKCFGAFILECQLAMRDNEPFFQFLSNQIDPNKDLEKVQ